MKQQLVELERIHLTRAFPWVNLFRAFRLALDVRKMILGALALLLLGGGLFAFSYLPLDLSDTETAALRQPPWQQDLASRIESGRPFEPWDDAKYLATLLGRPLLSILQPAIELVNQPLSWSGATLRWTQIVWALCIWSFFGTVISRMSAVQFAVDQRISLREALKFAGSKWLWVISAPLMPLVGVLALWLCCLLGGLIGRIPDVGPVILGVLYLVPILLTFAMVLLLIGLTLGWPLMIATVSTQGSDAFDGFSRSFDYVYSRFWHLLWFLVVATVHGLLMLALVGGVATLTLHLSAQFVGMGLGVAAEPTDPALARNLVLFWLHAVMMLVAGYGVSYFWTSSTIIYFLLRQSEDANHLSEVYLPETTESEDLVQLAGVAASDQPIIERPAKHDSETRQPADADSQESP